MDKPLLGSEIHGFQTTKDLNVDTIMEEAKGRWLRPREIHAILYNYKYFTIHVRPVNLPPSGTIVLFDRKMLRNFRKDGYNWKKRKGGKTVVESHEHLKVADEERIDVYYAHGEDSPTFVRRCYRLLDKSLEHIVLVHYRETQEDVASRSRKVSAVLSGNGKADKVNQGNARLKNLRVRKLIQKAHRMRKQKVLDISAQWETPYFSIRGKRKLIHGISACMEPLGNVQPVNGQPVNVPDVSAQWETPCCEQEPARYHSAPISEQIGPDLPNISIPKGIEEDVFTSADELMDFRGLAKINKAFVTLLDEVCSCHPSLIKCQMKRSPKFKEWAFTALGRVLHFLKTKKVKDMTDDICAELQCVWEELQAFEFDLVWLKPYVERALSVNKLVQREVRSLRKGVDDLEIKKKRLMAKLEVARRELEKVEGVEDKILGYGGYPFCGILSIEK